MSKEIAVVFDAICKTKAIKTTTLTSTGTQIESNNIQSILKAVEAAHKAVKQADVKRIISTIHIDETGQVTHLGRKSGISKEETNSHSRTTTIYNYHYYYLKSK
jgi:uncharacterized protein YqgV (UPF0045/DUF77 family)